jgi:hypothetical protein
MFEDLNERGAESDEHVPITSSFQTPAPGEVYGCVPLIVALVLVV